MHWHGSTTVYTCSPSWTPLQPPSPSHSSGSSQCTSPKLPVSCIEPGLAIHFTYDNMEIDSWIHISHLTRASALNRSIKKKKNSDPKQHPHQEKKTAVVDNWSRNSDQDCKNHSTNSIELFNKSLPPYQNRKLWFIPNHTVAHNVQDEKKIVQWSSYRV